MNFVLFLFFLHFTVQGEGRERNVTGIVNQSVGLTPNPFKSMADWYFNGPHRDAENGTLVLSSDGQRLDYVHGEYKIQVQPGYNAFLCLRNLKKKDEGWYKLVYDGDILLTYLTVLYKAEENVTAQAKGSVSFPAMPCRSSGRLLYHGADMHNNNSREVLRCDNKSSPGHVTDNYQTRLVPSCNGSSELTDLREEDGGRYTWECDGTTVCDIPLTVTGKSSLHSTGSSELTDLREEDGGLYTWECDGTTVCDILLTVTGAETNSITWVAIGIIAVFCSGGLLLTVWCKRKSFGAPCRRKQRTDLTIYEEVRQNEDNYTLELSGKLSQPNGNTAFSQKNSNKELIVDDAKRTETEKVLQDNTTSAEINGVGGNNNIIKHLKKETWEPVTPSKCTGESYNLTCNTDNGPNSVIIRNNTINKDKREMDPGGVHIELQLRNGINKLSLSETKSNSINSQVEVYCISRAAQKYHMDINYMDKRNIVTEGGTCTINMETDIDNDPVIYKRGEGQAHVDKPALDPDIDTNLLSNVNDNNLNTPFQNSIIDMYNHEGDIGKISVDPGPFTKDIGYKEPSTGGNGPLHINIDKDHEEP